MSRFEIAVVVGSLRRESLNRRLAEGVVKLGPGHFTFKQLRMDDMPSYNQDDDADQPPPVTRLKHEVVPATA